MFNAHTFLKFHCLSRLCVCVVWYMCIIWTIYDASVRYQYNMICWFSFLITPSFYTLSSRKYSVDEKKFNFPLVVNNIWSTCIVVMAHVPYPDGISMKKSMFFSIYMETCASQPFSPRCILIWLTFPLSSVKYMHVYNYTHVHFSSCAILKPTYSDK